ncbi:MAG: metallophosphoesterase [Verrucomicrobiota bacterium]
MRPGPTGDMTARDKRRRLFSEGPQLTPGQIEAEAAPFCTIASDDLTASHVPMTAPRIRIFSDLHFGDPCSTLRSLEALTPLFGDADELIFNGDTLDTVVTGENRPLQTARAFFAALDRPVTLLSGNHDPDISGHAELSVRDDRVWITHGDVLFPNVAPWSHYAAQIPRRLAELATGIPPADLVLIETRLRLNRIASGEIIEPPAFFDPSPLARLRRLAHVLFPPTRPLAMLRAWRETPRLAAGLAREQRPRARVVVLGHTHHPGVWSVSGSPRITVINTGSFTRPFGAAFVDIHEERVRVTRIKHHGATLRPGRVLADFTLRELSSE